MNRTVFWSWQSDLDPRVTRNVAREAIVLALQRLDTHQNLEERTEIDHDTRGVPGSPDIVSTIYQKIENACAFVADLTPIVVSENGKHLANPNVLIELGFAKKALGSDRIVTLWNTSFTGCKPEDLPFDLRGRRAPISFCLPEGAGLTQYREEREKIVDGIFKSLSSIVNSVVEISQKSDWMPSTKDDPSIWIAPGTVFPVNEDAGSGSMTFSKGGRWYVRILPTSHNSESIDSWKYGPFLYGDGGYSWGKLKGGILTYSGSVRVRSALERDGATMWFQECGELWTTLARVSYESAGRMYTYGDDIAAQWADTLVASLRHLSVNGSLGPYRVKIGVTGLEGTFWRSPESYGNSPPAAVESVFEYEFQVSGAEDPTWGREFKTAWSKFRSVYGLSSPNEILLNRVIQQALQY